MKLTYRTKNLIIEEEFDFNETVEEGSVARYFAILDGFKNMVDYCTMIDLPIDTDGILATTDDVKTVFNPPSEKQIAIMKKFNIPYDETTSMEKANELIHESIEKAKRK